MPQNGNIIPIISKASPLCFLPNNDLVCYQHGRILILRNGIEHHSLPVFASLKEKVLGKSRALTRLCRLGVRTAIAINDDIIIVSVGNCLYEINLRTGKLSDGFCCGEGIRPLAFSSVKSVRGFDNGIFFGGYLRNTFKKATHVYRRIDTDLWEIAYTFAPGVINHVHNVVADIYRDCLWVFTGDFDDAAAIWKVTNNFQKVDRIVYNNQKYRGCVVFPQPEGLLYATDSPFADNYINLFDPESLETKEIFPLHGSSIYGCKWRNEFVFSSTVEGNGGDKSLWEFCFGKKRGTGIKDEYVHMYMGNLKKGFWEIYKENKDYLPYNLFQFGAFRFPSGVNNTNQLFFMPIATFNHDLDLMCCSIDEEKYDNFRNMGR